MKLSFEFFPPRSPAQQRRFWRTLGTIETLAPEFVSITWGALGSDQAASLDLLAELQKTDIPIAAHLTCCGQTKSAMRETLSQLLALDIKHFVALRGDLPEGQVNNQGMAHAIDLVKLISSESDKHQHATQISVAAYPETHPDANSAEDDLYHLKQKLDAGATRALTQFFFDADSYLQWRDKVVSAGITKDIVPGILPIHDIQKVQSFSEKCGAIVPKELIESFNRYSDKDSLQQLAVEHAYDLCQTLHHEGVDGFHFYTMNQSDLAWRVGCLLKGKEKFEDLLLDTAA